MGDNMRVPGVKASEPGAKGPSEPTVGSAPTAVDATRAPLWANSREGAPLEVAGSTQRPSVHGLIQSSSLRLHRAADDPGQALTPAGPAAGEVVGDPGEAAAPLGLLVEDDAAPGLNQMGRSAFMAALRGEVCRTVDEVLAGTPYTSQGCPYVEFWLGFYADRSADHVERAVNRYAPDTRGATSAQDYLDLVSERVRRATAVWRDTGRVTEVPEGIPANSAAPPIAPPGLVAPSPGGDAAAPVAALPVNGPAAGSASPQALQQQLGRGAPLEGGVRGRLEPALGVDLSHVRVHTDPGAAALSQSLRARAFTVGEHVAFGTGQYRPGTPVGDALLAHELAHTVQQGGGAAALDEAGRGGAGQYAALEQDADATAFGAVTRLWGQATEALGALGRRVAPGLRSGLRLQRCKDPVKEPAEAGPPETVVPKPAQPDAGLTKDQAEAALVAYMKTTLADNKIEPAEWAGIGNKVRELKLDDRILQSRLSFELDFDRPWEEITALLALDENPIIKSFASSFTTSTTAAPIKFATDPLPPLVSRILADMTIDLNEFDALRKFSFVYSTDIVRSTLSGQAVAEPTLTSLVSMLSLGYSNYEALKKQPGVFPIKLKKDKSGTFLGAEIDLRQSILKVITADDAWEHTDFAIVRSTLGGMRPADATAFLVAFGLDPASATLLGGAFTTSDMVYKNQVGDRGGLDVKFQRTAAGLEMTPQSLATWQAPWHPRVIAPLAPVGGKGVTSKLEEEENIGKYKFASGQEKQSGRITMTFRGQTIKVVMAEELYEDATLFDRVDAALSVVPPPHLKYLIELVLDPGNDPGGFAIANASRSGTVNMFFSGAGPQIAQASLNETTAHEVGHLVSFHAEKLDAKFWDKWKQAIKDDGIAVSRYGTTNELEDFAESYVLYLSGGGADAATRARFKNRWALLDPIFKWS